MKMETAKRLQRIFWHFRWVLLIGLMVYNGYSFFIAFQLSVFLPVNGFIFALYSFMGMLEAYFNCKVSCKM